MDSTDPSNRVTSVMDALCHKYRRRILYELQYAPSDTIDPFAVVTDYFSHDTDNPDQHVRISLHHNHLPKLANYRIIGWTQGEQTITKGERFSDVEPFIKTLETSSLGV